MAAPNSDAMKSRIINHMNEDHQNSLTLYSRHYNKLPLSHAKTSKLVDITLDHMVIESSFGRCLIPIDPPMKSYAEARDRVVAMHQESILDDDLIDRSLHRVRSSFYRRLVDNLFRVKHTMNLKLWKVPSTRDRNATMVIPICLSD